MKGSNSPWTPVTVSSQIIWEINYIAIFIASLFKYFWLFVLVIHDGGGMVLRVPRKLRKHSTTELIQIYFMKVLLLCYSRLVSLETFQGFLSKLSPCSSHQRFQCPSAVQSVTLAPSKLSLGPQFIPSFLCASWYLTLPSMSY